MLEERAKDVLHEVISLRNSLRPFNRLNPEIIVLCAAFVSDTDPTPIVSLTHVCRHWRRAIISNPRNWASIGSRWKRLVPLCLERAGAFPLTVKISASDIDEDEDFLWDKHFLQALLPHISRISHLSLTEYWSIEKVEDDLPGFFASPMSNLTSLELEQIEEPTESFPSNEAPTPPYFQNVSTLTSLHLTRIPICASLLRITSLVQLKLIGYTVPFDFGRFIRFLHSNPNLEFLILDLQFIGDSVSIALERKVSLPQLRRLVFTCASPADAKGLLSSVSFPRGVHIEIQGSHSNPCAKLASFLPCPLEHIQQLLAPITAIKYQPSPRLLHMFGGDGQFSFQSPKVSSEMYEEFDLFATGAVRQFQVNVHPSGLGDGLLSRPLERLPALEVLVISGTPLSPGPLSVLAKEPILCPSLKTIAFFDYGVTSHTIRQLEEVQAKRRDSGAAQLHRVVILNNRRSLPDLQSIHRLREFIPRVDVGVGDELPNLL